MFGLLVSLLNYTAWGQTITPDSCNVTLSVKCPKGNSKYWLGLVKVENGNKLSFIDLHKKITLAKGTYKFTAYSEFGDTFDTTIVLNKEINKIVLKVNWFYIFQDYSNPVFLTEGDTISINYEKKSCCGGSCCHERDEMYLYKTKGQYFARYFTNVIFSTDCYDTIENTWTEKLLAPEKTKVISNYFQSKSVHYDKKKVIECTVKIGRHIYVMNYGTYQDFRNELIN